MENEGDDIAKLRGFVERKARPGPLAQSLNDTGLGLLLVKKPSLMAEVLRLDLRPEMVAISTMNTLWSGIASRRPDLLGSFLDKAKNDGQPLWRFTDCEPLLTESAGRAWLAWIQDAPRYDDPTLEYLEPTINHMIDNMVGRDQGVDPEWQGKLLSLAITELLDRIEAAGRNGRSWVAGRVRRLSHIADDIHQDMNAYGVFLVCGVMARHSHGYDGDPSIQDETHTARDIVHDLLSGKFGLKKTARKRMLAGAWIANGYPWRAAWEDPTLEDEARAFLMSHPEVRKELLLDQANGRGSSSSKRKL